MYDATVKVPTGIEYGNVYQFGNFDQCMSLSDIAKNSQPNELNGDYADDGDFIDGINDEYRMKPKYCLAEVEVHGYVVRTQATRHFEVS